MKYVALDCHKQYDHATMIDTETGGNQNFSHDVSYREPNTWRMTSAPVGVSLGEGANLSINRS